MRVSFLIDGFNLYHSLKDLGGIGVRWLDLIGFCKSYLPHIDRAAELDRVLYFSALATHLQGRDPDAVNRHRTYISCLEDSGVDVVLGQFKSKAVSCRNCGHRLQSHEEKETDVAIAAHLIEQLADGACAAAVLVTGDTDLAAGVKVAKRMFPHKEVIFIFPFRRKSQELAKLVSRTFRVKGDRYRRHQFPDPYTLRDGSLIPRPRSW